MLFIKYIDNILKIRIINIILNPQDELNLILKFELSIVSNVYLKDSQFDKFVNIIALFNGKSTPYLLV